MLFTFPSRYSSTIGLTGVFSLAGWSRQIRAGFLVPRVTQDSATEGKASHKGLSPATARLSRRFRSPSLLPMPRSYNPDGALPPRRFRLFPGRSPLLGESFDYFLFLQVLRCFSSLRSPYPIRDNDSPSDCRVVPFGNPRIKGHLHLPAAYRSLSRPSSPP